ncbi:MAG TPA: hypothetical protein EYO73_11945 [Sulfurimonas sp.]|nr:hypothetical protein [Sulfurimonas sp.]
MKTVIKEKLEEVVALLNDPEEVVLEKEIREKLVKILAIVDHPEIVVMAKRDIEDKLKKVMHLINKAMVDPDIDIDYFMPEMDIKLHGSDVLDDPYILVTYVVGDYNKPSRKIRLRDTVLERNTPESIANQVTFSIEEFKGEIDSVEMG